jgi:hypothetical protein
MAGTRCRRRAARITISCSARGAAAGAAPGLDPAGRGRGPVPPRGLDFETVKRQARTAGFRPIDLGARFSADFGVDLRVESHNVLGRIAGLEAAGRDDHVRRPLGRLRHRRARRARPEDPPGALDDALGIAGVSRSPEPSRPGPRPERSLVFAAWTAEERGLLGSEYYATNPLFPMETMVANLTLDTLQPNGLARDVVLIGKGQSDLEDRLAGGGAAGPDGDRPTPGRSAASSTAPTISLRQARRAGASADGARRRRRPGRGWPRGGRPLGQRVHRQLLSPDLRRMAAGLGFQRRRPGRRLALRDRPGAGLRSGSKARRRGGSSSSQRKLGSMPSQHGCQPSLA